MKKYLSFLWIMFAILILPQVVSEKLYAFIYEGSEYQIVSSGGVSWDAANTAAQALGIGWHLAVITSAAENAAVTTNLPSGIEYWLGGYQYPYAETVANANWQWVTNEAWGYTNWLNNEPNDYYGAGSEQYLTMSARPTDETWIKGMWNDGGTSSSYLPGNISGYIARDPSLNQHHATARSRFGWFGRIR